MHVMHNVSIRIITRTVSLLNPQTFELLFDNRRFFCLKQPVMLLINNSICWPLEMFSYQQSNLINTYMIKGLTKYIIIKVADKTHHKKSAERFV
jgi:hypothetical protein